MPSSRYSFRRNPSCRSQPSALCPGQELLPARHLHPVLYTDCSVVDPECLCWLQITPFPTLRRSAPFTDYSVLDTWVSRAAPGLLRARHLVPLVLNPDCSAFNTCRHSLSSDCSGLLAWSSAPVTNCFVLDTWPSAMRPDCSVLSASRPVLTADCSVFNT